MESLIQCLILKFSLDKREKTATKELYFTKQDKQRSQF